MLPRAQIFVTLAVEAFHYITPHSAQPSFACAYFAPLRPQHIRTVDPLSFALSLALAHSHAGDPSQKRCIYIANRFWHDPEPKSGIAVADAGGLSSRRAILNLTPAVDPRLVGCRISCARSEIIACILKYRKRKCSKTSRPRCCCLV